MENAGGLIITLIVYTWYTPRLLENKQETRQPMKILPKDRSGDIYLQDSKKKIQSTLLKIFDAEVMINSESLRSGTTQVETQSFILSRDEDYNCCDKLMKGKTWRKK